MKAIIILALLSLGGCASTVADPICATGYRYTSGHCWTP